MTMRRVSRGMQDTCRWGRRLGVLQGCKKLSFDWTLGLAQVMDYGRGQV
jgi:hypothetical protein